MYMKVARQRQVLNDFLPLVIRFRFQHLHTIVGSVLGKGYGWVIDERAVLGECAAM
jgi:hypothetical protein